MKAFIKASVLTASLAMATFASANTTFTLGAQAGTLSAVEGPSDTGIGYGAFVQVSALEILSLQVDYFTSKINSSRVQGIAPDVMFALVNFDELKVGLLGGAGFYKAENDDKSRFGLNGGAFAEVSFVPNLPLGLEARYHSVFGGSNNDLWSVFLTLGYRFGAGGGDDW